jgi:hypothetical protein
VQLDGEVNEDHTDANGDGGGPELPTRYLSDYTFFHRVTKKLISLEIQAQAKDIVGSGQISSRSVNDEDAAQEDELFGEESVFVQLGKIEDVILDYSEANACVFIRPSAIHLTVFHSPFYIRTAYAWYILLEPSLQYQSICQSFMRPHSLAQLIISHANRQPMESYRDFCEFLESQTDLFGTLFSREECLTEVRHALRWYTLKMITHLSRYPTSDGRLKASRTNDD